MATKVLKATGDKLASPKIMESFDKAAFKFAYQGQAFVEVEVTVPKDGFESVGLHFKNTGAIPDKLKARIPTFVPRKLPKMDSETLKKLKPLTVKLADWLSDQLPDILTDEELTKLAGDTVTICVFTFHELDFDSEKFYNLLKEINLATLMDNFFDHPAFEDERKKWINGDGKWKPEFLEFLSVIETAVASGDFETAGEKAFRMEIVHQSPVLSTFMGSFWEVFRNGGTVLDTYIQPVFWKVIREMQTLNQDSKQFGEEVFRYCRYMDSETLPVENILWRFARPSGVTKEVTENPFYSGFRTTGEKLVSGWNDILGLQKDLQTGDFKNMIVFKAIKGAELKDAWESEIDVFNKNMETYQEFKERLFKAALTMEEEQDLEFLVDIWDSLVFSFVLQGKYSPKYGMGNMVQLVGIEGQH